MEYIIESFCASIFFAYIFYKWANKNVDYFAKRNIAHEKPFFLLGTNLTVLEGRETTQELLIRLHNQFKKEKIYGYHDFRTPKFVISDPQLIEKVTVKDFEYFLNRCENQAILSDDIASRMLCAANDKTWIEEKAMVSHLFTEDKISQVFEVVNECNRAAIMYLKRKITTEGKEIDLEDYFHRYSNDVIASAAFGVKINSFNNRDNEFFNMAADLLRTRSLFAALKAFYLTISPHVYKVYRLNRVYIKALQFVRNIFSRIFGSHQGHQTLSGDPKDAQKGMEFTEIIRGFLTKFSSVIKSVVLIVFPQISLIVNFIFFIQSIRSYVKNFFNPKPKERKEERITPTTDEIKPRDSKNKVVRGGQVVLRNIAGGVKSVILAIFPQLILISRLYLFIKTAINYFRGKTVGQAVLQKKKKLSKVESALLKLERFVVVMKLLILTNFPAVKKLVKIRVLNTKALNYMKCLATQTLQSKEDESIVRQDMIHYMLESRKKIGSIMENEEIVSSPIEDASKVTDNEIAQCIMFLFAGLQQISKLLCVIVYELMKNPDIQEKLLEEALKMKDELKGAEISYETLTKMTYLDMVVREALRKWPSEPILNRVCTKPYTLTDAEGRTIQEFKPRDIICVSVYASHFDEEYFENPFTFDPERFSNEKKSNIKAYTYFPFGVGARNCKGKNFGLIVVKLMLYHLILEFNFSCGLRSTLDLFAATRKIQLKQSEFFWMKLLPRSKEIDLEESNVCLSSNEVIEKQA